MMCCPGVMVQLLMSPGAPVEIHRVDVGNLPDGGHHGGGLGVATRSGCGGSRSTSGVGLAINQANAAAVGAGHQDVVLADELRARGVSAILAVVLFQVGVGLQRSSGGVVQDLNLVARAPEVKHISH